MVCSGGTFHGPLCVFVSCIGTAVNHGLGIAPPPFALATHSYVSFSRTRTGVDWLPNATMDGWDAYQRHYSAADILGPWVNHGLALNHSTDPTAWDSVGQVR